MHQISREVLASQLLRQLREDGGFTIDPKTWEPANFKTGYFVSVSGFETKYSASIFTHGVFSSTIRSYSSLGSGMSYFIGAWEDNGFYYFDLSLWIEDKEDAIEFGRANDQLAIWDIAKCESIKI